MKRVLILGSTGSIGQAAMEIIQKSEGDFEVCGLAAGANVDEIEKQLRRFPGARFALKEGEAYGKLLERNPAFEKRCAGLGQQGIKGLIEEFAPLLVVNALVGIAGLVPTITALRRGCRVALANKESLVTAGKLIRELIGEEDDRIIPVDSEHFSLSRCLRGYDRAVKEIILTASGGPFRNREVSQLADVSVEEVLDHPTWKMGKKVSVDSALLLNKGLEVIEAHYLFGFDYRDIKVVIHPQSLAHSIIRLIDGSLLAHFGPVDMRLPLMNALYFPEIREYYWESLALEDLGSLEFIPFQSGRYPAFELALAAAREGGTSPAVLNAADEIAIASFLSGKIDFLTIIRWIEEALTAHRTGEINSVEDVLRADSWAREFLTNRHKEAVKV
ncbi:MAG: 1-deoxy-D-xylulose-5-phosphate reductoisomerase [Candidatus Krumholzibacteriota bacterium]|nr:1-deoxy-D-xylulose-5-phosphate reductoisomerase [Candidatus Krumholzibacteriota bacterium]